MLPASNYLPAFAFFFARLASNGFVDSEIVFILELSSTLIVASACDISSCVGGAVGVVKTQPP